MGEGRNSLLREAVVIGIFIALAVELIAGPTIEMMEKYVSPALPFLLGILILLVSIYYYRKRSWFK